MMWQQQQRVLLLISAILSSSTPSTIASSFVLSSPTAMIGGSKRVVNKNTRYNNNYNPLLHVTAGGSQAAPDADSQEEGSSDVSPPPPPPVAAASSPEAVSDVSTSTTVSSSSLFLGPNSHQPPGLLRSKFPKFPWYRVPNLLTYMRCLAIPVFVGLFYLPAKYANAHLYTGSTFAIASATDWLDGYLARRWDIASPFGAFLDPVADKLMVSTSLILLAGRYGAIVAIPTLIILAREIAVSALREWMASRGERNVVKVGIQGKIKTALTMVALTILLFVPSTVQTTALLYKVGIPLLYLSALVTITSGSVYFMAAAPALMGASSTKE